MNSRPRTERMMMAKTEMTTLQARPRVWDDEGVMRRNRQHPEGWDVLLWGGEGNATAHQDQAWTALTRGFMVAGFGRGESGGRA